VITEPLGGAHRDPETAFSAASDAVGEAFDGLSGLSGEALRTARRDKFLAIGRNLA
jgi:acetyl-CoA carboxylase carboxyl transferase subunit alpha